MLLKELVASRTQEVGVAGLAGARVGLETGGRMCGIY